MSINKFTIDNFDIQVWTTDNDPPCVAVNMTVARKALEGCDLTDEEKTDVTELMASYCRLVDELRLPGYGSTEFLAIADLFARGIKENSSLKEPLNQMAWRLVKLYFCAL